jgi:hypothetical protein
LFLLLINGAPTMIRTWDLPLRRRTLYPAELPGPLCGKGFKEPLDACCPKNAICPIY